MTTKEKLYQILLTKEYIRYYAANTAMRHLELIAAAMADETPLSAALGFEDTPIGSGHSLAMAVSKEALYIGAWDAYEPQLVRIPFVRIQEITWQDPCMVLTFHKGSFRIRTDPRFAAYVQSRKKEG